MVRNMMNTNVQAYPPGVEVFIGPGNTLRGKILAVTIREVGVTMYDVAWWDGNTRQNAWLDPGELTPVEPNYFPLQIGFITGDGV